MLQDLTERNNPLALVTSIARFIQTIHEGNVYRFSSWAHQHTDELGCRVELLKSQSEGELVDYATQLENKAYSLRAQITPRTNPA